MKLYSDPDDFISKDIGFVLVSFGVVLLLNIQYGAYLGNGQDVPRELALAILPALALLLWAHWRLEFDVASDLFKLELIGLGAAILAGAATVSVLGTPSDPIAVVETRIFVLTAAVFLYSSVCAGVSVANHTLRDSGKDVPDPGDF